MSRMLYGGPGTWRKEDVPSAEFESGAVMNKVPSIGHEALEYNYRQKLNVAKPQQLALPFCVGGGVG